MKQEIVKITYDYEVDALYMYLLPEDKNIIYTDSFSIEGYVGFGDINIDFNKIKEIVGIEILNVKGLFGNKFAHDVEEVCLIEGLKPRIKNVNGNRLRQKDILDIQNDKVTKQIVFRFLGDDMQSRDIKSVIIDEYISEDDARIGFNKNKELVEMAILISSGLLSKNFLDNL